MEHSAFARLVTLIERLTGPNGCPWDRVQTPESLADYVVEESHELAAAIRAGAPVDICEELGDVAFLILFMARLYAQKGVFTLERVFDTVSAKMVRRHPHVFADTTFANLDEQLRAWEAIKRAEHESHDDTPQGMFDGLPRSLPALIKAYRIHSKAARVGFTWTEDADVEQQAEAEWLEWLDAVASEDTHAQSRELGDLIFTLVELGRRKGIKANDALDHTNMRFLKRFAGMEALAHERGLDFPALSLDQKDELWNEVKVREKTVQ